MNLSDELTSHIHAAFTGIWLHTDFFKARFFISSYCGNICTFWISKDVGVRICVLF